MKMKLFLLLTPFVMLMQSCTKDLYDPGCGTKQSYYYPLTSGALKQTPYFTNPTFDTISFASDKGDTLIFVKTKTDTTWYDEQGDGSPDCGYDKNYYQTIHNTYATIKGIGSFDVRHSLKNAFDQNLVEISLNTFKFYINDYTIGLKLFSQYIGNLSVNNKTYNDVMFLYNNNTDSLACKSYFNKEYGTFYYEVNNKSEKWSIIE